MSRLHRIVLTLGPPGFIAGALQSQLPLSLQSLSLQAQLLQGLQRQGNALRPKRLKHKSLNRLINTGSSHFLAILSPVILGLETTAIDRIIALRPRVTESHTTPTAPADDKPL